MMKTDMGEVFKYSLMNRDIVGNGKMISLME
jgi:hypothetical protein